MSKNNSVFNVLPTSGDSAILAKDQTWDALADGQLGIFNSDTGLSVDATSAVPRDIHFITAHDTNGDGQIDDIRRSPGFVFQTGNVESYNVRKYNPPRTQKFVISGIKASCDTTYSIKFQGWNDDVFRTIGWNAYSKRFTVDTGCCDPCADCECGTGSCKELAYKLAMNINETSNGMLKAGLLTDTGAALAFTAYDAYAADAANKDKCLDIEIESMAAATISNLCGIPVGYSWTRVMAFEVILGTGFTCSNGLVTETQELMYEQGAKGDIQMCEYQAGGWNGNPGLNRQYAGGLARPITYLANAPKYDQIWITNHQREIAGWHAHDANLSLNIAVPSTDSTTLASVIAVLDVMFSKFGFDALSDDLGSQSSATGTDISSIDNTAEDGIG